MGVQKLNISGFAYLECLWVQQVRNDNTIVEVDAGTTPMTYTEEGAKDPSKKRTKKHV